MLAIRKVGTCSPSSSSFLRRLEAALLAAASDADSDTTWEKAAEVLGIAEVIRYKMDNQLDLTAQERVYIINHLK